MRRLAMLPALLLAALGSPGAVQGQVPVDPQLRGPSSPIMIAVNPLGFLQFGPTVETEFPAGRAAGVMLSYRRHSWGLVTHMLDEDIESGWMVGVSPRFYLDTGRKPAGWYGGPRFEAGKSDSGTFTSTVYGGGLEGGHRWLFDSGLIAAAGFGAGYFASSSENKPGYTGEISPLKGAYIMGVVNIGFAVR